MKKIVLSAILLVLLFGCNKDEEVKHVKILDYLPAYPGSYWDYTNATRSKVDLAYKVHSYQSSGANLAYTKEMYVPMMDGHYVYGYSITQNSTIYPLKKLLSKKVNDKWEVNKINGVSTMRRVTEILDSLVINFPPYTATSDSIFKSVVVVVEYIDSLGFERWNVKEYYANKVGLIRRELDDPFDKNEPILEKEIQAYKINH